MAPQALNLEYAVTTTVGSIFSWKEEKEKTIQEKGQC